MIVEAMKNLQAAIDKLESDNADLAFLARGCKDHYAYRVHNRPRGDCHTCVLLWQARHRVVGSTI